MPCRNEASHAERSGDLYFDATRGSATNGSDLRHRKYEFDFADTRCQHRCRDGVRQLTHDAQEVPGSNVYRELSPDQAGL
jgi:hypothetical protein